MANDSEHILPSVPLAPGHRAYVFEGRDSRVDAFRRLLMQVYADIRIREAAETTVILLESVVDGFSQSARFRSMLASVTDPKLVVLSNNRPRALRVDVVPSAVGGGVSNSFETPDENMGLTVRGIEAGSQWVMRLCEDATSFSSIDNGDEREPLRESRAEHEAEALHEAEQLLRAILSAPEPRRKPAANDNVEPADPVLQRKNRGVNLRRLVVAAVPVACVGFLLGHLSDKQTLQASRTGPTGDRYFAAELMDVRHPASAPIQKFARATPLKAAAKMEHEPRVPSKTSTEDRHTKIKLTEPDSGGDQSQTELALALPPDATVAVHLTGKALEDALAKDRIATRRLNDAQLSKADSNSQ